jgi:murein DD-endopeptidase MepM/ murein hydrolase activator NlpD
MKKIFLILTSLYFIAGFTQIKLKITNEKTENGFKLLAENNEFCPVTVKLDITLNNLFSSNGNNKTFVIPAQVKGHEITTLQIIKPNTSYSYNTKTLINYGDHNLKTFDDYNYSLPYKKGESYKVDQGYNGSFSHQNENALDFTMPVGTEIFAARSGVVIQVMQNNHMNCAEKKCAEYNNYIVIYHSDGTFAKYIHLKQNGSLVKEGDAIKENDLIGYSGNVGWSNGPHLHFVTYFQRMDKIETLKTKFKINDGKESIYLKEKSSYLKNY